MLLMRLIRYQALGSGFDASEAAAASIWARIGHDSYHTYQLAHWSTGAMHGFYLI